MLPNTSTRTVARENLVALVLSAAAALLLVLPAMLGGFPAGHDTNLHASAWFDVIDHWKEGVLLPAWGARFAQGLGQPIYTFYPPLSLLLGASLTALFGASASPAIFTWLCAAAGGFGTFLLARKFLPYGSSLVAAFFYIASPYLAIDAYERNAFAELLAAAIFPYALWSFYSVGERRTRILRLASALFLIALSNIPSAIVCASSLLLLSIIQSAREKRYQPLIAFLTAQTFAALWAAFFLLPAAIERQWVHIEWSTSGNWNFAGHFPFALTSAWLAHDAHSEIRIIVLACVAILCLLAFDLWTQKAPRPAYSVELWMLSAMCIALMLSFSKVIYQHLPVMQYIQFPWRYLLVLSTVLAVLAASLFQHPRRRYLLIPIAGLIAFAWHNTWPPQFYRNPSATWSASFNERTRDLAGLGEYMPRTVPLGAVERAAQLPRALVFSQSQGSQIAVTRWHAEDRRIQFQVAEPSTIVVRVIYFPGWQATINGVPAQILIDSSSGLVQIPVRGTGELHLHFARGADSLLGLMIALLSIVLAIIWRRRLNVPSHEGTAR